VTFSKAAALSPARNRQLLPNCPPASHFLDVESLLVLAGLVLDRGTIFHGQLIVGHFSQPSFFPDSLYVLLNFLLPKKHSFPFAAGAAFSCTLNSYAPQNSYSCFFALIAWLHEKVLPFPHSPPSLRNSLKSHRIILVLAGSLSDRSVRPFAASSEIRKDCLDPLDASFFPNRAGTRLSYCQSAQKPGMRVHSGGCLHFCC